MEKYVETRKPFDLTKREDRIQFYSEMKSFLRTFTEQGTDKFGRERALTAFLQLKEMEEKAKITYNFKEV